MNSQNLSQDGDFGSHDSSEGADVVEVLAHPFASFVFFGTFCFFRVAEIESLISFLVLLVVNDEFFEVDAFFWLRGFDEVANFTFEADIGDQAVAGFRVDAWEVSCVGVAVGVGVDAVEEVEEIVSVVHDVFLLVG